MPLDNTESANGEASQKTGECLDPPISRVSFKAPPFWKVNPKLYFAQIESQFIIAGITADNTKFHHLIAAIETDVIATVSDIVLTPPAKDKYETLKTRLIEQFQDSETQKIKMLLQELQLGDDRPSQLLRKMKDLSPEIDDQLLKNIWLQRLPTAVQQILAVSSENVDSLAKMADKVMEVTDTSSIHGVDKPNSSCSDCSRLQRQVEELTRSMEHLRGRQIWSGRQNWRPRSRSRSSSRPRFDRNSSICFYHQRFGEKARNCNKPCSFQTEN